MGFDATDFRTRYPETIERSTADILCFLCKSLPGWIFVVLEGYDYSGKRVTSRTATPKKSKRNAFNLGLSIALFYISSISLQHPEGPYSTIEDS